MKSNITSKFCQTVLLIVFLLVSYSSFAAIHTRCARLSYAYVSGSTYRVTLTLYVDCGSFSVAGELLDSLMAATPQICIYDGATSIGNISLAIATPDSGIEVTQLCPPGDTTQCTNTASVIPGIKKFVFTGTYAVPYTSAAWRFIFNGYMGHSIGALYRQGAINSLASPSTTALQLVDTLNNTVYNNSNPSLNAMVPMGFALNQYNAYNPDAIDSDGDALTYMLVQPANGSGDTSCTIGASVSYIAVSFAWIGQPLSATTPIQDVSPPPAYNFNTATGQFLFYPLVTQNSTVVYNIEEFRSGTMVGTSQMELNFVVLLDTGSSPFVYAPGVGPAVYSPGCGSLPDTVSVSGVAISCGISGVQWQSSPDNVTWTNIAGATADVYTYTSTTSMYYRCFQVNTILGDTAYGTSVFAPASAANLIHWSVVNIADTLCDSTVFNVTLCDTSSFCDVTTYFGDGTSSVTPLSITGGICGADISHWYSAPGTFLVKEVLSEAGLPIDSGTYSYNYFYCRILTAKFYYDADSNCIYDPPIDFLNYFPLTVEIDSDGVAVDTISATSGIYYTAYGGPGTIYSFKVLSTIYGLYVSCPASGILSDTISSSVGTYPVRYFALRATPGTTGFDLVNNTSLTCSPLAACGSILVYNTYPIPVPSTLTLSFSPKYYFDYSSLSPTSSAAHTATWNAGVLSSYVPMTLISFHLITVDTIPFGDTVNVYSIVDPLSGDIDTLNNICSTVDTVLSAFDPNYIAVAPQGYITSGTQLQYTIHFENTGNDTAYDIFVMDTLSQYVDPHTLTLVGASAPMNIWTTPYGANEIVKFDFPNINLLDSSYHGHCDGMLVFNIKAKSGLPNGTIIPNHAGVFFDYNPAVLTNTVNNIIGTDTTTKTPAVINGRNVTIFPNPANTQLNILMTQNAYTSFTITNNVGQEMLTDQPLTHTTTQVNIATLPAGVYYITFRGDNGTSVQKFVKM